MRKTDKDQVGYYNSEKQLVDDVISWLGYHGCFAWRQNTGAATYEDAGGRKRMVRFGMRGISDVLAVAPNGRFVAVECKLRGNKPTPEQELFLAEVRERGGVGVVAYDADELEGALGGLLK